MARNCWEVTGCGMQPNGPNVGDHGVCPACLDKRLHGANDGLNAGRACWVVEGTLSGGERQGTFLKKLGVCRGCEFHIQVRKEQGDDYVATDKLLRRLRSS